VKRPRRTTRPAWGKLRPWLLPVVALVAALFLLRGGFDGDALRNELASGAWDEALERLSEARPQDLAPGLADVDWWPAPARRAELDELRRTPDGDLLEAADAPTLVAPLDRHRSAPPEVRLREPADRDLAVQIRNVDLGLVAADLTIPAGRAAVPLEIGMLAGTTYDMTLRDGSLLAYAGFELLPRDSSDGIGVLMASARDLAATDDEAGGQLLAALVALDFGLTAEALDRLRSSTPPGPAAPVRDELVAIALARQGLDRSALELVDG